MSLGVEPHLVVGCVDAHGLLAHSALIGVSGGLVVVRERDDGRTHAQNHRGMDLAVGVCDVPGLFVGQVIEPHRNHGRLLLFDVYELYKTFLAALVEVPTLGSVLTLLV